MYSSQFEFRRWTSIQTILYKIIHHIKYADSITFPSTYTHSIHATTICWNYIYQRLFFLFWWHLYFHIERTTANEMHTHTKSNHRWEKTTHSNISLPSLENGAVYIMLNECDSVILIKINERVTVHNVALRLHLNTNNHEKKNSSKQNYSL